MIKILTILFLSLLINDNISQPESINTNKYLIVSHNEKDNLFNIYNQGNLKLETLNDTPYSKILKFKEGWSRFYDWKTSKFVPKDNGSNRLSPLNNTFTVTNNLIKDSEYSTFIIKSSNKIGDIILYNCIDNTNKNCIVWILTENNKKYIFIQYKTSTYIYGS